MDCNFGNSANFVLPGTQKSLAQCPKVRKVLFLPEFCPLECSTGREEWLTDEPAVFLQIRVSSEKPWQNIKLYLLPNKFWSNFSSGHMDFVFDTIVENFCHKSGISSLKIRKDCQTYFFSEKNHFVSNPFSGLMECGVNNSAKNLWPTNQHFFAHCPYVKIFDYCQIFSHEMLDSAGHVECLPRSSSFSFEVSADAKFADLITLADQVSKNMEIFR